MAGLHIVSDFLHCVFWGINSLGGIWPFVFLTGWFLSVPEGPEAGCSYMSLTIQLIFNITKWYWLLNMSVLKYQIGVQAGVGLASGYWDIWLFQWSGPFLSLLCFCVDCRTFHWIWQDSSSSFSLQMMLIHLWTIRERCGVNTKIAKQVSVIDMLLL